jgi:Peptidase family S41
VDPNAYATIPDYFNALLVRTPDANGVQKDRFSAVLPASLAQDILSQSFLTDVRANHTNSVPVTKTVTSPGGRRVGYIQFNDHESGSQDDLIAAFRQVAAAGIQDLVLDLRFNSGGFLYVAQTAASMITGPVNDGKVFEQLRYNDKRFAETNASTLLFSATVPFTEPQNPAGTPLPRLSLPRVYALTSGQTCSSSESIINGLRGVDVQVVTVGDTTCGKPYGFRQKNNCGYAFFPIEFKGANAKGFGDYTAGFTPTCRVADNPNVRADDPVNDPLFRTALSHADSGACPAGTLAGVLSDATPQTSRAQPSRPAWAGRLLWPQR